MAETLLSVEHLRVQYGRFLAVDDVSFALAGGELLGLIGPNGAGKTTTLRAVAGLQAASTGTIRVLGFDVYDDRRDAQSHLGFTPDDPPLYPTMTVREYLAFIARCYRLSSNLAEQRIAHWLEALWLTEKTNEKISALSRGMRQRLGVARTLLPDPHLILLDEPAGGLDPAGRVQFRRLLASLRDQGKAIIVSSHILADLAEYCTHIGIMERGQLRQFSRVEDFGRADPAATARYRIVLAHRVADFAERLRRIGELERYEGEGDTLLLEAAPGREAAAALLARLVAEGLPVAEFQAVRPDLEEAYLRAGIAQVD